MAGPPGDGADRGGTLIRLAALGTFPLEGGRLSGGRKGRPCEMWESSGFAVGADDPGGPRAHTVRPYGKNELPL